MSDNLNSYVPPDQYNETVKDNNTDNESNNINEKIKNLQFGLKSQPKYVCCPYCNKQGMTKINQSCSLTTGVFCVLGAFVFTVLVQLCRGKDLNCTDAEHYCISCGNKLASYKSCC